MSYILDALRRADAERERGRVPGIHARSTHGLADEAVAPRAPSPWRWIALGLGLGLGVMLVAGWWFGHDAAPPEPPPAAAMNPPPPIPSAPPRPIEPPAPPVAAEPMRMPIEQRPTAAEAAAAARRAAAAAARPSATGAAAAAATASAAGAPGGARLYARHELPEEIRRQLPPVVVGGSIYSPSPANRFVVINGQVVHEGGEIGPDHVLEAIRLKSAVLRFKGYRYEILF